MKKRLGEIPIPGGSLSTILGAKLSARRVLSMVSIPFDVTLSDASILSGEIDGCSNPSPKANILLVHGLGSSCHDPSIVRQARYLAMNGFKVFRLNHRNSGSGKGKAKGFYHGLRGADIKDALVHLQKIEPNKKWILIGHSLSGNMVMKIAGSREHSSALRALGCAGVAAVSPVVDLGTASRSMHKPMLGLFDKVFMQKISRYIRDLESLNESLRDAAKRARCLAEFDEMFLAPALGLERAEDYYNLASSRDVLHSIELPTEVFLAKDDPIAPGTYKILTQVINPNIRLHASRFGGHLGFIHFDLRKLSLDFSIDREVSNACDRILASDSPVSVSEDDASRSEG
jgi:predicted alpha/beta-fold hydrolase